MNILFMGSGEFAVPTLRALAKVAKVQAVFTQPDRPAGRHLQLKASAVKQEALHLALPVCQPDRLKDPDVVKQIEGFHPDALVVASYGQIVPKAVLDIPRLGPINLHGSLLPRLRGAAPVQWAIINGERQTGVTTFFMDPGLDSGPLLLQRAIRIEPEDNALTLESKLAQVGSLLMLETLDLLSEERLRAVPQDPELVTTAPKLKRDDGFMPWERTARSLDCFVRGMYPDPGAYTLFGGNRLKVHRARVVDEQSAGPPGQIVGLTADAMWVQTGAGVLELLAVQPASRSMMSAGDFARGYRLDKGALLGQLQQNAPTG